MMLGPAFEKADPWLHRPNAAVLGNCMFKSRHLSRPRGDGYSLVNQSLRHGRSSRFSKELRRPASSKVDSETTAVIVHNCDLLVAHHDTRRFDMGQQGPTPHRLSLSRWKGDW